MMATDYSTVAEVVFEYEYKTDSGHGVAVARDFTVDGDGSRIKTALATTSLGRICKHGETTMEGHSLHRKEQKHPFGVELCLGRYGATGDGVW
jgi:hypothetical protein